MQNGNTKETTSNETEEIELKMFHNWTIDSEVAYFKEAADAFHKEYPNVALNSFLKFPCEGESWLQTE